MDTVVSKLVVELENNNQVYNNYVKNKSGKMELKSFKLGVGSDSVFLDVEQLKNSLGYNSMVYIYENNLNSNYNRTLNTQVKRKLSPKFNYNDSFSKIRVITYPMNSSVDSSEVSFLVPAKLSSYLNQHR